jgi:hypothetical protein
LALVASCSCCMLQLLKIASCASSTLMQEIQPCALDEGDNRSPRSPPVSTVVNTRDCLKFHELKYKVVTATKVVGEHSHPNLFPPGQSRVYLTGCRECALSMVPRVWHGYVPPPRTTLERPRQLPMVVDGNPFQRCCNKETWLRPGDPRAARVS